MLRFYNTYSKKTDEFVPLKEGTVTIYNCGPTVYDHPHIGNFRAFLFADILRRYLEFKGYKVIQVMNITDVGHLLHDSDFGEDRIQLKAQQENKSPYEIAKKYTDEFFELVDRLNIKRAHYYPKATEHIQDMIEHIKKLIDKGYAYIQNNAVYFDVSKFPDYGKLSGNTVEKLIAGKRVEIHPDKKNPCDFALWKYDPKHIMQWESPWGKGFPGWHIECSVMASKYLGESIDIHTGGEDNIFPHHECEIAQSEAVTNKKFVKYWLHVKHLLVNGQKMSKSLGNFYTVQDVLNNNVDEKSLRFFLISVHYRQPLNFTWEAFKAAKEGLNRINYLLLNLEEYDVQTKPKGIDKLIKKTEDKIIKYLDNDINMSGAIGVLFDFIKDVNKKLPLSVNESIMVKDFLFKIDSVLGCLDKPKVEVPPHIIELAKQRFQARMEKRFDVADKLREQITNFGFLVEDTKNGFRILKK